MQFLIDVILTLFYLAAFLVVCAWAWRFWKMYINQKWLNQYQKDCVLLEIKLPREIFKSPLAMELALTALLQSSGTGTWYERNVKGQLINFFSLEIASLEGVIHFYIRGHKKFRSLIETNLYAQYPGIEITQADDYTAMIRYTHLSKDTEMWGLEFPLGKSWKPTDKSGDKYMYKGEEVTMPADYLPIKTYVDYGLDKDPKEEFKTDPITPLLEFLGSLGKGQYAWYQILTQDESRYNNKTWPASFLNKKTHEHMTLAEMASARKKQIRTANHIKPGDIVYDEYGNVKTRQIKDAEGNVTGEVPVTYNFKEAKAVSKPEIGLTAEEKEELEQINRKVSKPILRVIIRLIYISKIENQNGLLIPTTLAIMRPFSHSGNVIGNVFGLRTVDPYDYPWQNTMKKRIPWRKEEMYEAYVEREGFFPHIEQRESLDKSEDLFFWPYSMAARKKFRMIFEALRHPFDHPHATVSCLNLEELATIWHFPGAVAGTPTLPRIDSTKGIAPVNLPQ